MRILIVAQYYKPENIGAAIWISELAESLVAKGHQVTMLTTFPNYPKGEIFDGYRGKFFQRDKINGVEVIRVWIYSTSSKSLWPRILNFGSFCATALFGGILTTKEVDVIYAILPPLPLGVSAVITGLLRRARVVVNIQDIYPYAAEVTGFIKNRTILRFFEGMEKWIYKMAHRIVVISEGFRENIQSKGIARSKINVVPNWADPSFINPGPKKNSFRDELGVGDQFTLIYSGGLTHNSNVEPVIGAADLLRREPFAFAIIGDGVHKKSLEEQAITRNVPNIQFKPFQPLERYPEVLLAGDLYLVTLSNQAAYASVPSKIFKQMAAGRPILAITASGNEVDRLVKEAKCGICIPPDNPNALAEALRWAANHPEELARMGQNARRYLEEHHSRGHCVAQIEEILQQAITM